MQNKVGDYVKYRALDEVAISTGKITASMDSNTVFEIDHKYIIHDFELVSFDYCKRRKLE